MLSRLLREILFSVIHLVVNVLVAVQNVYQLFWIKKFNLFRKKVTTSEIKLILENVPNMSKKLNHLVVLTDTNHYSMSDLAHLVIWSLVAGIPYVSFYDKTGMLKKYEEKLFCEIERNKKGVPGCVKWSTKPDLNGYSNGNQANTINVNIFTYDDGRPVIVRCVHQIIEQKLKCHRSSKEFTAKEFDEAVSSVYPVIPDPDLALYSGPLCSTYGLLPWQIRLTEFVQLSSKSRPNVYDYLGALYKFNKCDQRFGK